MRSRPLRPARSSRPVVEALEGRRLPAVTFTQFALPPHRGMVEGLAAGSDGALWYSRAILDDIGRQVSGRIGRITPAGVVTEFDPPTPGSVVGPIAAGPDGALWFTERMIRNGLPPLDKIARMTTDGTGTDFALPTATRTIQDITAGPDGALWFTETITPGPFVNEVGRIGRITTSGALTEFDLPSPQDQPQDITAGPDGALWFTQMIFPFQVAGRVDRITTAGVLTQFDAPQGSAMSVRPGAGGIATGPDANLWFAPSGNIAPGSLGALQRITPAGVYTQFPVAQKLQDVPVGEITTGLDGALWFSSGDFRPSPFPKPFASALVAGRIGRITPDGGVTSYPIPVGLVPGEIATGPDGAIWYAANSAEDTINITRLNLDEPLAAVGQSVATATGQQFVGSVASFLPAGQPAGAFSAAIDWGDGSPMTTGLIAPGPGARLNVFGEHRYARAGSFPVTVTITLAGGGSAVAHTTATVAVPPRVIGFARLGIHRQPTRLVLAFSAPMDPSRAQNPRAYTLSAPGPDRRFGTRDDRFIRIDSATYDPSARTVTLRPHRRLNLHRPFQLIVSATPPLGLAGADGIPLDGNGDGQPGGDYVMRFGGRAAPVPRSRRDVRRP